MNPMMVLGIIAIWIAGTVVSGPIGFIAIPAGGFLLAPAETAVAVAIMIVLLVTGLSLL